MCSTGVARVSPEGLSWGSRQVQELLVWYSLCVVLHLHWQTREKLFAAVILLCGCFAHGAGGAPGRLLGHPVGVHLPCCCTWQCSGTVLLALLTHAILGYSAWTGALGAASRMSRMKHFRGILL